MENYEPISPPQSYQGMDKQEASGPPPQRREAESEIRYGTSTVYLNDSIKLEAVSPTSQYLIRQPTNTS